MIPLQRSAKRRPAASSTVWRPRYTSPAGAAPAATRAWFARTGTLPTATLHQPTTMMGALRAWFAVRWAWFRPRSIPFAVAFAGMIAILAATNALTEMAHHEEPVAPIATKYQTIKIVNGPAGAQVQILDTARR